MKRLLFMVLLSSIAFPAVQAVLAAPEIGNLPFQRVWMLQDWVVANQGANRSWTWGPTPISAVVREPYAESPGGMREVQYFPKSRMEITFPDAPISAWYVTNGLLPIELMTGRVQAGDNRFEQRSPASIAAVGDPGSFPTYADLGPLHHSPGAGDFQRLNFPATMLLTPDRGTATFEEYVNDPATYVIAEQNNYGVIRAFMEFMNQRGPVTDGGMVYEAQVYDPLFVFGLPVTQPFWVKTRVGGVERYVLFQVYERRVLTYNPANPDPWKVEMGNVGQHYYDWRYGE